MYFSGWFSLVPSSKYLPVDSCKQSMAVCQQFIVPFWQGNNSSFQTTWNLEDKSLGFRKNYLQRSICDIFLRCFHFKTKCSHLEPPFPSKYSPDSIAHKVQSQPLSFCFVLFWSNNFALEKWQFSKNKDNPLISFVVVFIKNIYTWVCFLFFFLKKKKKNKDSFFFF